MFTKIKGKKIKIRIIKFGLRKSSDWKKNSDRKTIRILKKSDWKRILILKRSGNSKFKFHEKIRPDFSKKTKKKPSNFHFDDFLRIFTCLYSILFWGQVLIFNSSKTRFKGLSSASWSKIRWKNDKSRWDTKALPKPTHSVWKSPQKSHSTLRAKRATFTFWVDKSSLKNAKNGQF